MRGLYVLPFKGVGKSEVAGGWLDLGSFAVDII